MALFLVYMAPGEESMQYMAVPVGYAHQHGYYMPHQRYQGNIYPILQQSYMSRYDNSNCIVHMLLSLTL